MSEQEILKQCADAFPGLSEGHHFYTPDQMKAGALNSPENQAKQSALAKSLGFPESIDFTDTQSKTVALCSDKFRKADWDRDMAAEIKSTLATVDDKIAAAGSKGLKEAQIMRVGAEQSTLPTWDHVAVKTPPELNDRQRAILDALNHKPGIEADLKKDSYNVYWIVARHK